MSEFKFSDFMKNPEEPHRKAVYEDVLDRAAFWLGKDVKIVTIFKGILQAAFEVLSQELDVRTKRYHLIQAINKATAEKAVLEEDVMNAVPVEDGATAETDAASTDISAFDGFEFDAEKYKRRILDNVLWIWTRSQRQGISDKFSCESLWEAIIVLMKQGEISSSEKNAIIDRIICDAEELRSGR